MCLGWQCARISAFVSLGAWTEIDDTVFSIMWCECKQIVHVTFLSLLYDETACHGVQYVHTPRRDILCGVHSISIAVKPDNKQSIL